MATTEPDATSRDTGEPHPILGRRHEYHGLQPVLYTRDVGAAFEFYTRVLGFEADFLLGDPPNHGRVRIGDRTFGDPVYIHLSSEVDARGGRSRLRIHVGKDLDALCSELRSRGVAISSDVEAKPWGLREFLIADLDGHEICFCGYSDT